jgi:hypothetical protein
MGSLEFFNVTLIWYTGVAVFAAEADAGAFLLAAFRAVVFFVFVVFRAGIFFISLKPGANAAEGVERLLKLSELCSIDHSRHLHTPRQHGLRNEQQQRRDQ